MCRPFGETTGAEPRPIPGGSDHVNRVNSGACPSRDGTRVSHTVRSTSAATARAADQTTLDERHDAIGALILPQEPELQDGTRLRLSTCSNAQTTSTAD